MKNKENPEVNFFFNKDSKWQEAYNLLREIALACQLKEELKWGVPCYSHNKRNIVLIHGFKEYCALLFHKGSLLIDKHGILIQQTKNVQAGRQIRFTNVEEIEASRNVLKSYIEQAIEIEKAGLKVEFKKTAAFDMPVEFQNALEKSKPLNDAFYKLTPGRQRAYIFYFSTPKQSKTRESRVLNSVPNILAGKGIND